MVCDFQEQEERRRRCVRLRRRSIGVHCSSCQREQVGQIVANYSGGCADRRLVLCGSWFQVGGVIAECWSEESVQLCLRLGEEQDRQWQPGADLPPAATLGRGIISASIYAGGQVLKQVPHSSSPRCPSALISNIKLA